VTDDLERFFAPRSLAIVGASDDPAKIGGRPIKFLREMGFDGPVYPVNPHRDYVQGLPCFRTIEEIPHPFDHAILAVPVEHVAHAMEACAARGARDLTIFTSGFAEVGEEGRRRQQALGALAARLGVRLLGPNCQGFANVPSGVYATFSSALDRAAPVPGPVAVIGQSGVLSAVVYVLLRQAGIGVGQLINTGNEVDIDAARALAYAARRPDVSAAALALETVRDGDAFADAMAEARARGTRVFVLKGGRTETGAAASVSHTGAMLGRDDAYDALFRQTGAVRVETLQALTDAAALAARVPRVSDRVPAGGPRLGIITNSGGANVLIADAAIARGVAVPQVSAGLARQLGRVLPGYAVPQNPLDMTGYYVSHPEALDDAAGLFLASGEFDVLLVYLGIIGHLYQIDRIVASFERIAPAATVPLILVWQAGDEDARRRIAATGLPVFDDTDRAIAAIRAVFTGAIGVDRTRTRHHDGRAHAPARSRLLAAREARRAVPSGDAPAARLSPSEMRALLLEYGIRTVQGRLCRTPEDAAEAVAAIGGPAVLKVESPDIAHKTDAGGVRTGVTAADDARACFREIVASVAARRPGARIEGVRVEPMVAGVEVILGALTDRALGAFVTVGLGGILVEVMRDVVMRRLPLAPEGAAGMLADLRGRAVLEGSRGRPSVDRAALTDAIQRWAALTWDLADTLVEAEINPLIVGPEGAGAVAVDVVMALRHAVE
jgi:acyl-CoA synthetase (NDP forming)